MRARLDDLLLIELEEHFGERPDDLGLEQLRHQLRLQIHLRRHELRARRGALHHRHLILSLSADARSSSASSRSSS
jgi:hypothetical protein